MTNVMLTCRLDRSGVAVGVAQNVAPTEGGCNTKRGGGCNSTTFHFPLFLFWFFVLSRPTRTAPAERERTGATPTF